MTIYLLNHMIQLLKKNLASAKVAWKIDDNEVTSEPDRNSKIFVQGGWTF